ncbi:glycosyl hydrolase [Aspergillus bertholletiae]|uniref:Glycosyl hydrolase n=1 Tax=Aspergillus bertholletiae TaxID=1226010 RepID=A0A5N7BLL2_9EURO|nr:glycosyl hydrolase [Aspergillus bertholletiae]
MGFDIELSTKYVHLLLDGLYYGTIYIYTAPNADGPWTQASTIDECYYDCGLLITDDGKMYVAYENSGISVAELSDDGLSEVSSQMVFHTDDAGYLKGSRFYQHDGSFYIFVVHPANKEHVLMSTSGVFSPYERRLLISDAGNPVSGAGYPHQGGIVDTPEWGLVLYSLCRCLSWRTNSRSRSFGLGKRWLAFGGVG